MELMVELRGRGLFRSIGKVVLDMVVVRESEYMLDKDYIVYRIRVS